MSPLAALLRKDARVVYRDGFLSFLPAYALVIALVARLAAPLVAVPDFALYLAPAIVLAGALLFGNVLGFALIEEREQGTWLLLRVLPVAPRAIFVYLVGVTSGFAFCTSLLAALVYGLPIADLPAFYAMTAVASLTAPVVMLVLGVAASNKIEGLAVTKIFNLVTMVPAVVFVVPLPWQLLAAWCPWYWTYLGLLQAYAGPDRNLPAIYEPDLPLGLCVAASALLSLAAVAALTRLYTTRAV